MNSERAHPAEPSPERTRRVIRDGSGFVLARFVCPSHSSLWRDENVNDEFPSIAFPHVPVRIRHADRDEFVADRNVITLYNAGQVYRRGLESDVGDTCEFIGISHELAAEVGARHSTASSERMGSPFARDHAAAPSELFLLQQAVFRSAPDLDELEFEEATLRLIDLAMQSSFTPVPTQGPTAGKVTTRRAHAELAEATKSELSRTFRQRRNLSEIAAAVHSSPYHLARVFREHTGNSISDYRNSLRLREGLSAILDSDAPLTRIAISLGYSSHAHFTTAFTRTFGVNPSTLRQGASDLLTISQIRTIMKNSSHESNG